MNYQEEFINLQGKEKKLRSKIKALEKQFREQEIKINVLEEENKLLKAKQSNLDSKNNVEKKKSNQNASIYKTLEDFDKVFELQNHEIKELIGDRDKLVELSYKSIEVIDSQNEIIDKIKANVTLLFKNMAQQIYNNTDIIYNLNSFGIDVNEDVKAIEESMVIPRAIKIEKKQDIIYDDNVLNMINNISKTKFSSESINILLNYILQQIKTRKGIEEQIQVIKKENAELNKVKNELNKTIDEFMNIFETDNLDIIKNKVNLMEKQIYFYKNEKERINQIFKILMQHNNDVNFQCCINRIKRWLTTPESNSEISQDILFLEELIQKNDSNNDEALNKLKKHINQLQVNIDQLQSYIQKSENERKLFIKKNSDLLIPPNSSWIKICNYLLSYSFSSS